MAPSEYPFLCFNAADPQAWALALDYWHGDDASGRWKWHISVEDLAKIYRVPKKDVPTLARSAATAVFLAYRCSDCNAPRELSSRSSISTKLNGDYICGGCSHIRRQAILQKLDAANREKFAAERAHIAEVAQRNRIFDYDNIGYLDAVVAYGIMLASDEACESGSFRQSEGLHLCVGLSLSGKFLARLFSSGILRVDESTPPQAFEKSGTGWVYYPHRVAWRFAPDAGQRSFPSIMKYLGGIIDERELDSDYGEAVAELWRLLAYDDALEHLNKEVEAYSLPEVSVGPKTEAAVLHALEYFSIPQVRREITNVVKNAAALSQRRDFGKRHALNTISGTLISYVDRALSEGWQIFPMLRNWQNEEPVLLTLLFNRVLGTGLTGFKSFSGQTLKSMLS